MFKISLRPIQVPVFGSMERISQGTLTFDIVLAALIILMMAYLADRLLRWYSYAQSAHHMLTEQSQDFLCEHLMHLITYFSVLWYLLPRTAVVTFQQGAPSMQDLMTRRFLCLCVVGLFRYLGIMVGAFQACAPCMQNLKTRRFFFVT